MKHQITIMLVIYIGLFLAGMGGLAWIFLHAFGLLSSWLSGWSSLVQEYPFSVPESHAQAHSRVTGWIGGRTFNRGFNLLIFEAGIQITLRGAYQPPIFIPWNGIVRIRIRQTPAARSSPIPGKDQSTTFYDLLFRHSKEFAIALPRGVFEQIQTHLTHVGREEAEFNNWANVLPNLHSLACAFLSVFWGLFMFGSEGLDFIRAFESQSWPSTIGTVVSSRVYQGGRHRSASIRYSYRIGDRDFTGSRLQFSGGYGAEAAVHKYPAGSPARVYYSPAGHALSVLRPGFRPGAGLGFALRFAFGYVMMLIAALLLRHGLR